MAVAFALVLLIGLTRNDPQESRDPDWYWMMKANWIEECPLVIAGDSRVYRGVDPSIFERQLEIRALNIGFSSEKLSSPYLDYVREVVDASAEVPTIIFGISAFSFTNREAAGSGYTNAVQDNLDNKLPIQFKRILDEGLIQFRRYRPDTIIRSFALWAGMESFRSRKSAIKGEYNQLFHLNGWVASDRHVENPGEQWKMTLKERKNLYETDEGNIHQFLAKTREWTSEGIMVVSFRVPVSEDIASYEEQLFNVDFRQLRTDFMDHGGIWLDLPDTLELRQYDGSHLDSASAMKISEELAKQISRLNRP